MGIVRDTMEEYQEACKERPEPGVQPLPSVMQEAGQAACFRS